MRKGQEEVEVRAPVVVSNCGIFNTFQKLLPPEIQIKHGQQQTGQKYLIYILHYMNKKKLEAVI